MRKSRLRPIFYSFELDRRNLRCSDERNPKADPFYSRRRESEVDNAKSRGLKIFEMNFGQKQIEKKNETKKKKKKKTKKILNKLGQ